MLIGYTFCIGYTYRADCSLIYSDQKKPDRERFLFFKGGQHFCADVSLAFSSLNNLFWQKNAPNLEFGEGGTPQIKVYC